ncbi:RNA polymerase sigma factor [Phreatobacter stygius]|uniref:RNA polymerase sigma factor n=1 Tax=Phreatobacter stygius TaxID=1940610 RepID=A0A4D7B699_9HYPH|nr:RNA polymerase sigma factor [Phreatobacter stygius]QCI65710.1 RNA polymerase sigma factor [Phreatobacter stygius]
MTSGTTEAISIPDEIDRLVRLDGGRLLSCLIINLRDFQLAEDSLQDALESAVMHWSRDGLPGSPSAWLMRTARRKAIDRIRKAASFRSKSAELAALIVLDNAASQDDETEAIADERLKLIFTCCHPALDQKTSVALTLRAIGGLKTEEIARAFVVSPDSMAQRLVRARHKIAKAGIPYEVPGPDGWSQRLDAVLAVIYLIFNEGYAASSQQHLRTELCVEAIRLGRVLTALCPREPEVEGLLALMLLHQSRCATRLDGLGAIVSLEDQDRGRWDRGLIAEGTTLLERALRRGRPGPYQLQAAIVAVHAEGASFAETDWHEVALIYQTLVAMRPNPVFELNHIVALSYAQGPGVALDRLATIAAALGAYQPYHAVRADILARLGQVEPARRAYQEAIRLSGNDAERLFLTQRLGALVGARQTPA